MRAMGKLIVVAGPSYFSNAPVYVLPGSYSPQVRRYVRLPRYYW